MFEISCVCEPDAARAAKAAAQCGDGVASFATLADAISAEAQGTVAFDAVILMIPHHLHEEIALQAFAAGKSCQYWRAQ